MPLSHFVCPDKKHVATANCISSCRLASRCLTRTTLRVITEQERAFDGIPHVTNLLNGTMLEYLRINRDYAIDPKSRAFTLLGSSHHKLLEGVRHSGSYDDQLASTGYITELHIELSWIQGTLDLLEQDGKELILSDHKSWGSNRLARNLPRGYVFDPVNTPSDNTEAQLQLNMYRIMAKQQYGWNITKLQIQCTVRDGGLSVAVKRGVKENMYIIPVPSIPDEIVLAFFRGKAYRLQAALANKEQMPEPCSLSENWNENRCRSYCEVAAFCPVGAKYVGIK